MSSNPQDIIIEQYLSGALKDEALKQFELQVQTDPELSKRLAFHQNLQETLSNQKALDLQGQLNDLGAEFFAAAPKEKAKVISIQRRWLGMAAGLLVLIAASFFIYRLTISQAISGQELFAQHFETYSLDQVRSGSDPINAPELTEFEQAAKLYKAAQYEQAATAFQTLLTIDPNNESVQFSLAQSLLNTNPPNFSQAKQLLETLVETGTGSLVPPATWHLALLYVQEEQYEAAVPLLETVVESGGKRGRQAQEVLQTISK